MDIGFLKNVSLFSQLTTEELRYFASKMHLKHYKENDLIIKENDSDDHMFILYKGTVVISKKMTMIDEEAAMDKTFITLTDKGYHFFGEIGILGKQKRTANVKAKTICQLYTISHKIFISICEHNPKIGYKVLLEISRQLAKNLEKNNRDVLKLTTALIYALK